MAAKPNLDDPKLTVEIAVSKKQKAFRLATSKGWSMAKLIEWLIDNADESGGVPSLEKQVADLQSKTADLDARLHELQQQKTKKK